MTASTELTRNQSLVLGVLTQAAGPRSAYDILDGLRGEGMRAPLQIYRALEKLMEMGLVHRLESLNAFVACTDPHDHDKHAHGVTAFAICEGCGAVTEFHDEIIEERLSAWQRTEQFRPKKTTIEIRGHCQTCC